MQLTVFLWRASYYMRVLGGQPSKVVRVLLVLLVLLGLRSMGFT